MAHCSNIGACGGFLRIQAITTITYRISDVLDMTNGPTYRTSMIEC